jgi:hypothetical protein
MNIEQLKHWCCPFVIVSTMVAQPGCSQCEPSPGKTYSYSFKYLGMTVAHGRIALSDTVTNEGVSGTHIEASATSLPATSLLFTINNRYSTIVESSTGFPLFYEKHITQSNFEENISFRYDQKNLLIFNSGGETLSLSSPTHNIFSALYFMMNHRFQPKETLSLPVYAAGHMWEVTAKALRTERLATPFGTHPTVLVEIEAHSASPLQRQKKNTDVLTHRILNTEEKTFLWFSADGTGTLLKGEYKLFPANLRMHLNEPEQEIR